MRPGAATSVGGVALVVAAMALAVFVSRPEERPRVGAPFQRPGVVEIAQPEGVGTSRHVIEAAGRVVAQAEAEVIYRWVLEPVEARVEQPQGVVELVIGDPDEARSGARLRVDAESLTCRLGHTLVARVARQGEQFALALEQGRWTWRADDEVLAEAPAPASASRGLASLRLASGASFRSFSARPAEGEVRRVDGGEVASPRRRALWAALSTLGGLLCLFAWGRGLLGRGGGLARVLAPLVAGAVVVAAVLSLQAHNAARFAALTEPCDTEAYRQPEARVVRPGVPWDLSPRRDGDFTLGMDVTLSAGAVLDVLLRATPADRDTGLVLTLSSDPALPSSLSRNLGTHFETVTGPIDLAALQPGRTHAVTVRCEGGDTTVSVDGRELASLRDWDLRAGRCAFLALRGEATVEHLALDPLRASGTDGSLASVLLRWQVLTGLALLCGLALVLALSGRGAAGALWAWPLAVGVLPGAPDGALAVGLGAASLLLLLTPRPGRRLVTWLAGAALVVLFAWAATESPPDNQRGELNDLDNADVHGAAWPREFAWARHPLCRRFNTYVRSQRLREERVSLDKPPGTLRIAALGSSSTFGYGVPPEAAFIEVLETRLDGAGYTVEGLNCGQPGATAERLLYFLEGVVLPLAPDVVIIDLAFNDHVRSAVCDERAHFAQMTTTGIGPLAAAWARLSEARAQGRRKRYFNEFRNELPATPEDVQRFSTQPATRFAASLRDMVLAARAAGAAVVLVAEPYNTRRGLTPIEPFHAAMAALAAELDVPLVQPQARLDAAQSTREVFTDTVHPNPAGHAILAELLADTLLSEGLLDR